jgi:hypothetical protein
MSGSWGFWAVFGRAALAIVVVAWLAPLSGAQPQAGGAGDAVTSILDKYAPPAVTSAPPPTGPGALDAGYQEYKMTQERNRLLAVLLLAATALGAHFILLRGLGHASPNQLVNGTGLIYIVFGTIVLVTLSDNKDQLTASTGILGAVAGYLFGSMRGPGHGDEATPGRGGTPSDEA